MKTINGTGNEMNGNNNVQTDMVLGANNTGTGGSSSSEASSGHASMSSDSQTSGSPPAPADYSKLTGTPASIITNYKSVLKSVPEDESGSNRFISEKCSDSGNRSAGSSHSGGKKGSKSKHHRNKVK